MHRRGLFPFLRPTSRLDSRAWFILHRNPILQYYSSPLWHCTAHPAISLHFLSFRRGAYFAVAWHKKKEKTEKSKECKTNKTEKERKERARAHLARALNGIYRVLVTELGGKKMRANIHYIYGRRAPIPTPPGKI